jgi:hypothetical protein
MFWCCALVEPGIIPRNPGLEPVICINNFDSLLYLWLFIAPFSLRSLLALLLMCVQTWELIRRRYLRFRALLQLLEMSGNIVKLAIFTDRQDRSIARLVTIAFSALTTIVSYFRSRLYILIFNVAFCRPLGGNMHCAAKLQILS